MIRTPQEFVNEVRARFSERLNDEIEEHGKTVMHFAEENNRLRAERDKLRDIVRRLLMLRRGDIAVPMDVEKQILAEARAAIGEDAK